MRFAILTVSAIALTGCSWMGSGHGSHHAGHAHSQYGVNCGPSGGGYGYGAQHGTQILGYSQFGAYGGQGCGVSYGVQNAGYVTTGYGAVPGGFGAQTFGALRAGGQSIAASQAYAGAMPGRVMSQANAFSGATTLGAGAPFGAATANAGALGLRGTQIGAQAGSAAFVGGPIVPGGRVQTVVGSPIYVPQPYPAPYGVPRCTGVPCGGGGGGIVAGGTMPWGFEYSIGTGFDVGGDIFTEKGPGLALGSTTVNTGGSDGISYNDAFGQSISVGGTLGYDVSRNTTLLGTVGYSMAEGQNVEGYQSVDARSPGTLEDIDAQFSDLDLWTIEGGVRQYFGHNYAFRPYVGATGGFTYNNDVDIRRTYSNDGTAYDPAPFTYVESGWSPTASAVLGAEMAVGKRAAIGLESGIRWRDNMDTIAPSEDRLSIPLKLRGRVAF